MPETIDNYRCKLINKILFADSQELVQRYIDVAVKGLKENNVDPYVINNFLEKIIENLEGFNPLDSNPQQWANIKMSKIIFNRLKSSATPMIV